MSSEILLVSKKKNGLRGRPRNDEVMKVGYRIEAEIEPHKEYSARKWQKIGRFVLANYKNQAQVERGFRFLKDN